MRFEKWQALGNDYVIVEHDALPFALSPSACARCAPHTGVGADGVLELVAQRRARLRRLAADLQPRRLRGRAVGQRRARGDPVPAPGRVDRPAAVLDPHGRGRAAPDDPVGHDLPRRHGPRARRGRRGRSRLGATSRCNVGNPQCSIRVASEAELAAIDLADVGPRDRDDPRFPEPHERVVLDAAGARSRSARGSSSAAWGRRRRRGLARAARRWPTRCAAATRP